MVLRHVALSLFAFATSAALVAACHIETSSSGKGGDDDDDDTSSGKSSANKDSKESKQDESEAEKEAEKDTPSSFTGTQIRFNDSDKGVADTSAAFRALVVVPLRDSANLREAVTAMYTPGDPTFRKYLSKADFIAKYAPTQASIDEVSSFFTSNGMKVERVAANRFLLQISGTIGAFNKAFGVEAHAIERGTQKTKMFATLDKVPVPAALAEKITGVLTLDLPAVTGDPSTAGLPVDTTPPGEESARVSDVAARYNAQDVPAHGEGETIGIVGAGHIRKTDGQSFWQSQGITRDDAVTVQVAEKPKSINFEALLDVQWSGGLAPKAAIRFYQSPDVRDSGLVFAFNEAVGQGDATVINDSYAHNEAVEPVQVRIAYDRSAMAAAAMGITILSSSGDSAQPDTPGTSPFVTAVGGTRREGAVWDGSGCGLSSSFGIPEWQKAVANGADHRGISDISALADDLWAYSEGYSRAGGTSFSSPLTTGLFATLNSIRTKAGKPRVGWLNQILYTDKNVQAIFRDISKGGSGDIQSAVGYDLATGWGEPDIGKLADVIP
jgi:kumamolisin